MQHDVERPFGSGEQMIGFSMDEVFDRSDQKARLVNPVKWPGAPPPLPDYSRGIGDTSILGPLHLSSGRLDHRSEP